MYQTASRYELQEKLGSGSMGIVYRAYDRLRKETIAFKQVRLENSSEDEPSLNHLKYYLAQEFRTLTTLRHPHVVKVLDYGFNQEQNPYFTMEYLEAGETILLASKNLSYEEKLQYIMDLLQAVAYLHRHKILHRDLKPDNILISQKLLKVVDFGLAVFKDLIPNTDELVGTLTYMAPESLGGRVDERSDLYAVGLIAYELLSGVYPYRQGNMPSLLSDILHSQPQLELLRASEEVQAIIGSLLSKDPDNRIQSAAECIDALKESGGLRSEDSLLIRDSFLQAAPFIGRRAELQKLEAAVDELLKGTGAICLLAGDSGLGKSRLLNEIRSYALIKGIPVLSEQANVENDASYKIWDRILQYICLNTELTAEESEVLNQFFPTFQKYQTAKQAEDPRLSEGDLQHVILSIIHRQPRFLLILEDIHWANKSLKILKGLAQKIQDLPLLIIASYRDKQTKNLPEQFPEASHIALNPLNNSEIKELSSAITGKREWDESEWIPWLSRESEGNPFFIIEIIRFLANISGNISSIFEIARPQNIMASGVQSLIEHRLSRLPASAYDLLSLLAVTGREFEEKLIESLNRKIDGRDLNAWYLLVSDAGIMEIEDNRWRFSHEKLRSYFIEKVEESSKRNLIYEFAAQAVEGIYGDERSWTENLARLWQLAERVDKELPYAIETGISMFYFNNIEASSRILERAMQNLEEYPNSRLKAKAAYILAKNYQFLGNLQSAQDYYELGLKAAEELEEKLEIARYCTQLGRLSLIQKLFNRAIDFLERALGLFETEAQLAKQKEILNLLGGLYIEKGEPQRALDYYERAMAIK